MQSPARKCRLHDATCEPKDGSRKYRMIKPIQTLPSKLLPHGSLSKALHEHLYVDVSESVDPKEWIRRSETISLVL